MRLRRAVVVGHDPALDEAPIVGLGARRPFGPRRTVPAGLWNEVLRGRVGGQCVELRTAWRAQPLKRLYGRGPGNGARIAHESRGEVNGGVRRQRDERRQRSDTKRGRPRGGGGRDEARHDEVGAVLEACQSSSAADTDSHVSVESSAPSTAFNDASSSYATSARRASVRTRRSGSDRSLPESSGRLGGIEAGGRHQSGRETPHRPEPHIG